MSIPLHLAVHLLGLTVAVGLVAHGVVRRGRGGPGWAGLVVGGALLAASHLATGAVLAGDLAWPLYVRVAGYAALAVGAAGRLAGTAPVVVVLGPPAAHLAAAGAAVMAAVASLRGVLGRSRVVWPLAVGLVLWGGSDLAVRYGTGPAAALSIAGSLAVGWWLMRGARWSLLTRLAGSTVAVLLVLAVGLAAASGVVFSSDLQGTQLDRLDEQASARASQLGEEWPLEMVRIALPLAGQRIAGELDAAAGAAADTLDARARTITGLPGIDLAVLITPDGRVVGSWGATGEASSLPPSDEAAIAGDRLVQRALTGLETHGLVVLGDRELVALGVAPVGPSAGLDRQSGVLVAGRRIAREPVVEDIRRSVGAHATVLVGGQVAASTLPAGLGAGIARLDALAGDARVAELGDTRRLVASAELTGADGARLGAVALALDASVLVGLEAQFTRVLFLLTVGGLLVAAALAAWAARRTTGPVRRLTGAAEQVAAGDLQVRTAVDRDDEVGRLGAAFDRMTGALQERQAELREAAQTEADLRSRLEIVTRSMGEALLATDEDGRVTTANPAAAELLGEPRGQLAGRRLDRVLHGAEALGEPLVAALGGADDPGAASARGSVVRDGGTVPVAASAAPLTAEDGQTVGRVYVLRDISGEVEVERMKTEFLSNVSHELRTPLTPIKGYAEVLRNRDVDRDTTAEFATNIVESASRLERVVGMLVDFAALEGGRMDVALEPTDVGELVGRVLERWRRREPDRRLTRYVRRNLPPVRVDPDLLERTLEELLDNAVKFSDGPVRILGHRHDEDTVRLTVRDEGAGIPEEQLEAIMRDFRQVDGSATRRYGGLGLGLSIVRRILERFNGELRIDTAVDEGTDVHLLVPVVRT